MKVSHLVAGASSADERMAENAIDDGLPSLVFDFVGEDSIGFHEKIIIIGLRCLSQLRHKASLPPILIPGKHIGGRIRRFVPRCHNIFLFRTEVGKFEFSE